VIAYYELLQYFILQLTPLIMKPPLTPSSSIKESLAKIPAKLASPFTKTFEASHTSHAAHPEVKPSKETSKHENHATCCNAPKLPAKITPHASEINTKPTTLVAKIDVGWGNTLYIRGHGAGLTWSKGVAMKNKSASEWEFTFGPLQQPVVVKFLINDNQWAQGADVTIHPGTQVVCKPLF
jgi:hypothetical protein